MARRKPPEPVYEWSEMGEVRYGKLTTPERLAQELNTFRSEAGFKPQQIVEAASDPKSFLHQFFEWNDTKAAHNYRIAQARSLVASVRIVVTDGDEDLRRARAFYSLRNHNRRGYHDVVSIHSSGILQKRLLEEVDRELQYIVDRHIAAKAIVGPIIEEARRKLAEERAKYGVGTAAHL
jgi:hypothetical protein